MKIGILTSGGDTPGMNAVIRAVNIRCQQLGHKLVGLKNGWSGLLDGIQAEIPDSLTDQIDLGGTILGSSRTNPYKVEGGLEKIKVTVKKFGLDAIIAIGGEDTLGVASKLTKDGFPMVGVPKTIDNDLDATDYTFGFDTAVSIATEAIDRLKTTAKSHDRVIVVEIMGRHAGWMTLHAGLAGGAHAILIPEYPLSPDKLCELIQRRYDSGTPWGIIAVSEGYSYGDIDTESMDKDQFGHVLLDKLNVGQSIADLIKHRLDIPTRSITLGHLQRGGSPTAFDRVLTTQLGIVAMELIESKQFGMMPALRGTKIIPVPLEEAVARLKTVDKESWHYAELITGV